MGDSARFEFVYLDMHKCTYFWRYVPFCEQKSWKINITPDYSVELTKRSPKWRSPDLYLPGQLSYQTAKYVDLSRLKRNNWNLRTRIWFSIFSRWLVQDSFSQDINYRICHTQLKNGNWTRFNILTLPCHLTFGSTRILSEDETTESHAIADIERVLSHHYLNFGCIRIHRTSHARTPILGRISIHKSVNYREELSSV